MSLHKAFVLKESARQDIEENWKKTLGGLGAAAAMALSPGAAQANGQSDFQKSHPNAQCTKTNNAVYCNDKETGHTYNREFAGMTPEQADKMEKDMDDMLPSKSVNVDDLYLQLRDNTNQLRSLLDKWKQTKDRKSVV